MAAKKVLRGKELKKAKKLLGRQPGYAEAAKQALQAGKDAELMSGEGKSRIRMPYVSATPISSSSWN